jgi:hypothetical protein
VTSGLADVFARAQPVADTVLWEGYVLYPYRRSAAKNHIRFQWGVVGPAEDPSMVATALLDPARAELVQLRLRFLHLHRRPDGWDEAVTVERDLTVDVHPGERTVAIEVPGGEGAEDLAATVRVTAAPDDGLVRLSARVDNPGPPRATLAPRADALLHCLVGTHVLFAADGDAFVSLLEPPADLVDAAARCQQHRCWPVLVGPAPRRDLVLASPVILYDYPGIAPQSVGDFYDSTEIDEMLTLRVQTLTDDEKAAARATDPRAAAIVDRCDALPDEALARLHGVTGRPADREPGHAVDPQPEWSAPGPATISIRGVDVTRGSQVVLRPGRRADVHDMFIAGRRATVAEVVHDVDGAVHVAVLVDDDPAAELFDAHGRFRYFSPEEIVPVEVDDG